MTVLVLGNQLTARVGPVARRPAERVLLVEARDFATRRRYHPHRLAAVLAAMRHFRDRLRAGATGAGEHGGEQGRSVDYRRCETFREGLTAHLEAHPGDDLVVMRPSAHGAADRLRDLVEGAGGSLAVVENDLFLTTPAAFDAWADGEDADRLRHEAFYRHVRRETGSLMDGDEPVGGEWNYDEQNRETPPADYDPPDPPHFEPDDITERALANARAWLLDDHWADPGPFRWPVTREAAERALEDFVTHRLSAFGPYQDAMVADEWALAHSLLSVPLNLGLLHPHEVVEAAVDAYEAGATGEPDTTGEADGPDDVEGVPLNSVEGFLRQVLGWREFVRHAYRRGMPDLADANRLDAGRALPTWYWTGETDMACLDATVEGVRTRGYSHHVQRLMLLSNYALLFGVEPRRVRRWFQASHVDGQDWAATPNAVEMGQYAADLFATKPYAASANYVDPLSKYCADCAYDPDRTTGDGACPFNALYWDVLDRHEDRLGDNPRMALVYSHLADRDDDERAAIRERAATIRDGTATGPPWTGTDGERPY
ncbi:MAG: cryptochrome/photolyase family protein [Halobacteriaceae archaeon]